MRNECINSTSGGKSVTRNGFIDIDFLYDVDSFTIRHRFLSILAIFSLRMRSFDHITTSS